MIHNKFRYLLTLVALFAISTGAWADGTVTVTELKASEMPTSWENNNNPVKATDLPGFTAVTRDEAKALGAPAAEGEIYVFYAISNNKFIGLCWNNGVLDDNDGEIGLGAIYALKDAFKFYYTGTAEPPITVTWDASTKTGTFAMPGSDVVLTPIYAPAARFVDDSEKPTVATDEIVVGAQTKLITEGTQLAQGTMRYAVSESNTTKPALSAFSATVPTGQSVSTSGDWYVWYYIAGADTPTGQTPTAENTFNDSEIFAEPIKATVTAPPTFALDLAINADDKADWTMVKPQVDLQALDPLTVDVDPGAEVELKYNGQKRVRTVIVKPRVTFVAPVGKTDLTYNGTKTADATEQELIRANTGTVTGGTIYYSVCYHKVGETEFGEWSEWSTEKPKGINAGEYKIKYKIVPNKRYVGGVEESEEAVTTASIAKADGWVTLNSYSSTGWQVTTERQVVVTITGNHGGLLSALAFFGVENIYSASLNNTTVTITKPSSSIYYGEPAKVIITCAATDNFKDATATYTCRQ